MDKANFRHIKSDTHRLYLSQREVGIGMIGVFGCFRHECSALAEYLDRPTENYLVAVVKEE